MKKALAVLVLCAMCYVGGVAWAEVNIWLDSAYTQPVDSTNAGTLTFTVGINGGWNPVTMTYRPVRKLVGFSLFGIIEKRNGMGWDPQLDVTFSSANLAPSFQPDPTLYDVIDTSSSDDMISRAVTRKLGQPDDLPGPNILGEIAQFQYHYVGGATGEYRFRLDDTWKPTGDTMEDPNTGITYDMYSTVSCLATGTSFSVGWVPLKYWDYMLGDWVINPDADLNESAPGPGGTNVPPGGYFELKPAQFVIPEPFTVILMGTVFAGAVALRRRK
jgi:hypothetical protein